MKFQNPQIHDCTTCVHPYTARQDAVSDDPKPAPKFKRPLIRVTAIGKSGELYKWSFRGEPDWKQIEREVMEKGVAGVIEGACGFANTMGDNSTVLWKKELGDGKVKDFPGRINGYGMSHPDMPNCVSTFGCAVSIAALRARIREVYGKKEKTWEEEKSEAIKAQRYLNKVMDIHVQNMTGKEPKPEPQFKAGQWVVDVTDPEHTPFQLSSAPDRKYRLALCLARLSHFRKTRHGVEVLIYRNPDGNYLLKLDDESGKYISSCHAVLLARALGVQIAPAGMTDEVNP